MEFSCLNNLSQYLTEFLIINEKQDIRVQISTCKFPVCVHCSFSLVAPAEPSAPAREHIKGALNKCRSILQDPRIFVTQKGIYK